LLTGGLQDGYESDNHDCDYYHLGVVDFCRHFQQVPVRDAGRAACRLGLMRVYYIKGVMFWLWVFGVVGEQSLLAGFDCLLVLFPLQERIDCF
jgi:hypothetical protein